MLNAFLVYCFPNETLTCMFRGMLKPQQPASQTQKEIASAQWTYGKIGTLPGVSKLTVDHIRRLSTRIALQNSWVASSCVHTNWICIQIAIRLVSFVWVNIGLVVRWLVYGVVWSQWSVSLYIYNWKSYHPDKSLFLRQSKVRHIWLYITKLTCKWSIST